MTDVEMAKIETLMKVRRKIVAGKDAAFMATEHMLDSQLFLSTLDKAVINTAKEATGSLADILISEIDRMISAKDL